MCKLSEYASHTKNISAAKNWLSFLQFEDPIYPSGVGEIKKFDVQLALCVPTWPAKDWWQASPDEFNKEVSAFLLENHSEIIERVLNRMEEKRKILWQEVQAEKTDLMGKV